MVGVVLAFACLLKMVAAEEEGPSAIGVSIAATLIGAISFIMCLYYFINYDDEDIREMSWNTISQTISIFCAVLLFSSFNDMAEAYLINPIFGEGDATYGALLVDILHMIVWFIITQVLLAVLSGAAGPWQVDEDDFNKMSEDEQEELKEGKEVNMACFAVLCAHITGFASINAFGTVQNVFFSGSPFQALLTPIVALVSMLVMQRIFDNIRDKIALGDDGEKDEFEKMWDDECEEAENDVMGLALSFTTISGIRFLFTGCLPNQEGKEEECHGSSIPEDYLFHHTLMQKMLMLGLGLAFAFIIFIVRSHWPEWLEKAEIKAATKPKANATETEKQALKAKRHNLKLLSRLVEGLYVAISMCFSWSFFYGMQMMLAGYSFFEGEDELLAVVLALVLSFVCMGMIIPLDKLADADFTDDKCDQAIRSLMSAMGLLIGFGWEQCFDASVDVLAEKTKDSSYGLVNPHTTKLGLTVFCAGLLVPAWWWYMLPFIVSKGWMPDFPLQQAFKIAKSLNDDKEAKRGGDATEKLSKNIEKMAKFSSKIKDTVEKKRKATAPEEDTPYQALAGDESVEALKKQVAYLKEELAKAKGASVQAQAMLDSTMENMLSSMKQMHSTVARIEATA